MKPDSLAFLGAAAAEGATPADFGDLAGELVAARDATVVAPLTHLGLIEISGEDAGSFLHNQLTSDVSHLATEAAQHAAWCTPKGRMLASFVLYREGGAYRALLAADLVSAIAKRLQMYVLRSKVTIRDLSDSELAVGISGADAETALHAAALPLPEAALASAAFAGGTVIRIEAQRFIVVVEATAAAACWSKLASVARPVGTNAWNWLDVRAGVPLITGATSEEFLPQMASFDKVGGVSFHKGCYPGQEIVARAQYLGRIKRHLYRLHSAAAIEAGTTIVSSADPEHPLGIVANAAAAPGGGYDALAVILETYVEAPQLYFGVAGKPEIAASAIISA